MTITNKCGQQLNFLETGADGIYILDHVAFMSRFDKKKCVIWDESTGKKRLEKWANDNLPDKILSEYDVDLPYVEELFSQKMLNLFGAGRELKSMQLPLFKDSDNRMMSFKGEPKDWFTRSTCTDDYVWRVNTEGGLGVVIPYVAFGFVPMLRRKER